MISSFDWFSLISLHYLHHHHILYHHHHHHHHYSGDALHHHQAGRGVTVKRITKQSTHDNVAANNSRSIHNCHGLLLSLLLSRCYVYYLYACRRHRQYVIIIPRHTSRMSSRPTMRSTKRYCLSQTRSLATPVRSGYRQTMVSAVIAWTASPQHQVTVHRPARFNRQSSATLTPDETSVMSGTSRLFNGINGHQITPPVAISGHASRSIGVTPRNASNSNRQRRYRRYLLNNHGIRGIPRYPRSQLATATRR
jgi:hypothetical protein